MQLYVLIAPKWHEAFQSSDKAIQGEFTLDEIIDYNTLGYNVYHYPNPPSKEVCDSLPINPHTGRKRFIKAEDISKFEWVFLDLDLKDYNSEDPNRRHSYASEEAFLCDLLGSDLLPTHVVGSGNGVHAYYRVKDLDAKSYLRLSRRLARKFSSDKAVCQIKQLMRLPNTVNTKDQEEYKLCEYLFEDESVVYTSEQMDRLLPRLLPEDEEFCTNHYNMAYNQAALETIRDEIPIKFADLLRNNSSVKDLWSNDVADRSKADFRLAHLMFANQFTKEEAKSVLVNSRKALERAPAHRVTYATNIVDKIWTYEAEAIVPNKIKSPLSKSVGDILRRAGDEIEGTRFPCYKYLDNTHVGFRLSHVIGLVAGSGVGKTSMALNMFEGFVKNNPDYDHFFVSLEQPENEIALRWRTMCGSNTSLHEKVHIIGNHDEDGTCRDLSLKSIKEYVIEFQKTSGKKIGTVVIDHIGVLAMEARYGLEDGVKKLCKEMKAFAVQTNTMLIMQSQTAREKAGIGDLELNKDAAFGTSAFENFCDYLITMWQPLKRCYSEGAPTAVAYKFCKIRHKKHGRDKIMEDVCYKLMFDPETERMRELTEVEDKSFVYFLTKATNKRKQDRKTDLVEYRSIDFMNRDSKTIDNVIPIVAQTGTKH